MKATFLRLISYSLQYRKILIEALLLLIVATSASVIGPYLIKVFIDEYLTPGHWVFNEILLLVIAYIAAQLVGAKTFFMQALRFNRVALNVVQTIREEIFAHVQRLPMAYFDITPTGSLISRMTNDTEAIKDLYVNVISTFIQNGIRVLGILVAMAVLDVKLMLICAVLVPTVLFIMWLYQRISTPVFQQVRNLLSDINANLNESIQGMAVIQLMNQQQRFTQRFSKTNQLHYRAKVRNIIIDGFMLRALVDFIYIMLLAALLLGFGLASLSAEETVQIGVIYAFINYLGNITEPLIDMTSKLNMSQQALVSASRVFAVMDETPTPMVSKPLAPPTNRIAFAIERFSYDQRKDVLQDIHLDIPEGAFVGIVGHTGSGKSTLMSLLMSFYPLQHGQIRLGDMDLSEIPAAERTRRIGYVQQDPFIFSGTIADNIRLELELSADEIEQAARQAQLHEAVLRKPDGYQTVLTERGGNLSTGQRQLLSLARTLARRPSVLILDEATANIDSHTEALIQQSLMLLRGKITLLVIAHRLSTVQTADELVVLHQGQIRQRGTHRNLMLEEGLYKHMYELQQTADPFMGD